MSARRGIEQRNVFKVLPAHDTESIRLGSLRSGEPWFWPQALYTQDIVSLCLICQIIKPKVVFEIGTLNGYMAYHFALNTPDDSKIYTLDLPRNKAAETKLYTTALDDLHIGSRSDADRYCFESTDAADKITCLSGDSARFDFSPYHGIVDLFFIDGAHSYDYVRSDTLTALKCCHPGSVIAWHDFGKASVVGVSKWMAQFSRTHKVYAIPGGSLAFMVVDEM
jgi:predicted O-methyltransferase YrrM